MLKNKRKIFFSLMLIVFVWLGADFYQYQKKAVTVLAYHSVMREAGVINGEYSISEKDFADQLNWLKEEGYKTVALGDVARARSGGPALPDKPLVITFDDGYKDNLYIAMPLLERYGFSATVFVVTDFIGQDAFLGWDEVLVLQKKGFSIGSHTVSHQPLAAIDEASARRELEVSREKLQAQGIDARFLAYPHGSHSQSIQMLVREAGYLAACTGKNGVNDEKVSLYALKRINVPQSKYGLWNFKLRVLYGKLLGWASHWLPS